MECPICKEKIISPKGDPKSLILVISTAPTAEDILAEKPFEGQYGTILKFELARNGVDLSQLRQTCLWLHEPSKKNKPDAEWNYQQAVKESIGRKVLLLLGTDVTKIFLKRSATEVSGLPMTSDLVSAIVIGTRNPLDVITGTQGEFMLGIQKFVKFIKEKGYYK
jgi:uracil-DNA glycosylase